MFCFVVSACVAWSTFVPSSSTDPTAAAVRANALGTDHGFASLCSWLVKHGGRVNPSLAVDTVNVIRGIVATKEIQHDDELLYVPTSLVLGYAKQDPCDTVRLLALELQAGESSKFHAYLSMDGTLHGPQIPSLWDDSSLTELQGLPPAADARRHTDWYSHTCSYGRPFNSSFKPEQQAALMYVTRSSDNGLIPVYDLMNHHNGLINIRIARSDQGVALLASGHIQAGEQLYLTYGRGTPEIFRDYAFVEQWPQFWHWHGGDFYLIDGVVAIKPTPDLFQEIGVTKLSLGEYQARARRHNQGLAHDLVKDFAHNARLLLESLPTTADDDARILQDLKTETSTLSRDRMTMRAAIEYRLAFKQALHSAIAVAGEVLTPHEL